MRTRLTVAIFALFIAMAASPAQAQNREHLQLTADLRMIQE